MLIALLFISIILSIRFGSTDVSTEFIYSNILQFLQAGAFPSDTNSTILWEIRLPRTLYAVLCGMGLSMTGLILQTITRNSLSDPYILGLSSGAGAGAVGAIIFGWFSFLGSNSQSVSAFFGALLTTVLVVFLVGRNNNASRLVLIGVGISSLFSALTMLFIYSANHESQVRSAMFWLMGSFSGLQWSDLSVSFYVVLFTLFSFFLLSSELDLILLGENEAEHLGLSVKKLQLLVIVISSLCISVIVSTVGVVAFIGLIIPHLARYISGPKHQSLIIFSALIGGLLMVWADILSRTLYAPEEIPIGILTSCVGAPLFIWIVCMKEKGYE